MLNPPPRTALLVVGMHRSGTSAMARVLSLAGAALPRDLIPANDSNPTGHWEPLEIANFNDRLLAKLGTSWDGIFAPARDANGRLPLESEKDAATKLILEQYGDADVIVLKEPRLTLIADFWREVFHDMAIESRYIVMVRNPEEIADSLYSRNGFNRDLSLLIYSRYMASADLLTRECSRVFISYDSLLQSPVKVLDRIEESLQVELPSRGAESDAAVLDFIRADLRHSCKPLPRSLPDTLAPVAKLARHYTALVDGTATTKNTPRSVIKWLGSLEAILSSTIKGIENQLATVTEARMAEAAGRIEAEGVARRAQDQQSNTEVALQDTHRDLVESQRRLLAILDEQQILLDKLNEAEKDKALVQDSLSEMQLRKDAVEFELAVVKSARDAEAAGREEASAVLNRVMKQLRAVETRLVELAGERTAFEQALADSEKLRFELERRVAEQVQAKTTASSKTKKSQGRSAKSTPSKPSKGAPPQ